MKESNLKAKLGVALLLTVFSLNAIHAFNDYGVKENKLNYEVIANRRKEALELGLSPDVAESVWRSMIKAFIALEEKVNKE